MRVRQNPVFLNQILDRVRDGDLVPAAMQRSYVWQQADILKLCESIADGLPLGSLLTWRPYDAHDLSKVARPRLGPITPGEGRQPGLILDGQNRLASFAWMTGVELEPALRASLSEAEAAAWDTGEVLVFDAKADGFLFVAEDQVDHHLRLPTSAFFRDGMAVLREAWNRWQAAGIEEAAIDAFVARWDAVFHAFLEARMVETEIEGATAQEAKSIFLRICRTGVPMSEEDFDRALNWTADT